MIRPTTLHHTLGDFGTILPLSFGVILATGVPAGPVLPLLPGL